jgi:ubiquinone/menaquinone biosynthesis C-methylase UbiE
MGIAKKYEKDYWDGDRKYGYGGYKYIPGRLTSIAKKIIKKFRLNNSSKILDVGCGKGFLLYEIKKILPGATVVGLDISKHGIKNCHPSLKNNLKIFDAKKKLPFKNGQFDLALSFGLYHNFSIFELEKSLKEFSRVSKKNYLMVESYKNDTELFNLQCWALTCESFLKPDEWVWLFKKFRYKGYYEFIYFK